MRKLKEERVKSDLETETPPLDRVPRGDDDESQFSNVPASATAGVGAVALLAVGGRRHRHGVNRTVAPVVRGKGQPSGQLQSVRRVLRC